MVTQLNTYQLIFAVLLLAKIGEVDGFAQIKWYLVIAPLVIGSIHGYLYRLYILLGIRDRTRAELLQAYANHLKAKHTKKAIKDLKKLEDVE